MIHFERGDIFSADSDALVNTVNELGVMGKGLALMFREKFPDSASRYVDAAKRGEIKVGKVFVTPTRAVLGPRYIIHFPTKKHWRNPSKLDWITEGLQDLRQVVVSEDIRSIALPPLGCGNGGLPWSAVRAEIEKALAHLPNVDVSVFEPTDTYLTPPKESGLLNLTPARALLVEMVRRYSVLGLDCTNLEIQKIAWFLSQTLARLKMDDPFRLSFTAGQYGPYSEPLKHLLNALDGSYLRSRKRLSDAGPFDQIQFDESKKDAVKAYLAGDALLPFAGLLEATSAVIEGFESPLGMELLSTVDWLLTREGSAPTLSDVRRGLAKWPGGAKAAERKQKMFDDRMISIALERLTAEPSKVATN